MNLVAEKRDVGLFYDAEARSYREQYEPGYAGYPANLRRLQIVLDRAGKLGVRTLLDCGCGEGTPLVRLHEMGVDGWGFDLVPRMVDLARDQLERRGQRHRVWQGDILKSESFRPAGVAIPAAVDMAIATGVFPHVHDEVRALKNMAAALRPGGRVIVEFRNKLFSLFTMNRYSYEFFQDDLIRAEAARRRHPEHAAALDGYLEALSKHFRMDLPPRRTGTEQAPGYDEILARFHNPLEMPALFAQAGLKVDRFHFYHYHAIPPMFEAKDPELFKALSLEIEDPADWRGHFLCSAFLVEAVKEATR